MTFVIDYCNFYAVLQVAIQCSDGQTVESDGFQPSFLLWGTHSEIYDDSYPVGQPVSDGTGFTCHRKTLTDVQIVSGDIYGEPVTDFDIFDYF